MYTSEAGTLAPMARAPREHLSCTECGWVGMSARGRARQWVFRLSSAAIAVLVVLELSGVLALGDDLLSIGLTIMLLSLGLRLIIRGDRCRECGARAIYLERPPEGS